MLALPAGAIPLALGTVLAIAGAALVLAPLLRDATAGRSVPPPRPNRGPATPSPSSSVAALREIEFDRETGKLSDADYATLKATYTQQALVELRAADASASRDALATDPAEAAVLAYKARGAGCTACGARPAEPDAVYCSACGHYLPGGCAGCGAAADIPGQRFCAGCGESLAA
jgi:hypothetical protein